jgi:hypothetical protein
MWGFVSWSVRLPAHDLIRAYTTVIDVITRVVTDRPHAVMIYLILWMWIIYNRLERHALVAFVAGDWPLLESLAEAIQRAIALCVYPPCALD